MTNCAGSALDFPIFLYSPLASKLKLQGSFTQTFQAVYSNLILDFALQELLSWRCPQADHRRRRLASRASRGKAPGLLELLVAVAAGGFWAAPRLPRARAPAAARGALVGTARAASARPGRRLLLPLARARAGRGRAPAPAAGACRKNEPSCSSKQCTYCTAELCMEQYCREPEGGVKRFGSGHSWPVFQPDFRARVNHIIMTYFYIIITILITC